MGVADPHLSRPYLLDPNQVIAIYNEQIYDEQFAEVYDDIYPVREDYSEFAKHIHKLAIQYCPDATTLLDVACGTGEHLAHLRDHFEVTGFDLSEPMVRVARSKLKDGSVHQADMRNFDLGKRFDVVSCMYSSVGYLPSVEDLYSSVSRMVDHTARGGVLIVEPWVFQEDWNGGDLATATYRSDQRTVTRMGQWKTQDGRSSVEMHYLVAEAGRVRHFVNDQELSLFSRADYHGAFDSADCKWEYLPDGYAGKSVFIATRP